MKIWQYLLLHMKIICCRYHIKAPFNFWDIRTWDMWKNCLQLFRNNKICKLTYFLRYLETSRADHTRILKITNVKFSGFCFYMNTNISSNLHYCTFKKTTKAKLSQFVIYTQVISVVLVVNFIVVAVFMNCSSSW